jgi:hypothetical protein
MSSFMLLLLVSRLTTETRQTSKKCSPNLVSSIRYANKRGSSNDVKDAELKRNMERQQEMSDLASAIDSTVALIPTRDFRCSVPA